MNMKEGVRVLDMSCKKNISSKARETTSFSTLLFSLMLLLTAGILAERILVNLLQFFLSLIPTL